MSSPHFVHNYIPHDQLGASIVDVKSDVVAFKGYAISPVSVDQTSVNVQLEEPVLGIETKRIGSGVGFDEIAVPRGTQ